MKKNPANGLMTQLLFQFFTLFQIHSSSASNGKATFPHFNLLLNAIIVTKKIPEGQNLGIKSGTIKNKPDWGGTSSNIHKLF